MSVFKKLSEKILQTFAKKIRRWLDKVSPVYPADYEERKRIKAIMLGACVPMSGGCDEFVVKSDIETEGVKKDE